MSDEPKELAALLAGAYPALARHIEAHPEDVAAVARAGTKTARDAKGYRRMALATVGDLSDEAGVRRGLRRFASREKLRIAARELLPHAGSDVDVTARELADLADVCIDVALTHALAWAEARWGAPRTASGETCPFVVIGMGKLGGRELNAGSDVDLIPFYETDDGEVRGAPEQTLNEHFARVTQRLTSVLDEPTEDGVVWRVDLRLRPEGSRGPLVNALAAAERYYETWGRTWERAALVRARPVAGDIAFGARLLDALGPFVWRRAVDPSIADEMMSLIARARAEMDRDPERDLKLGPGGIREAEFFVQSLQLIWGGREKELRATNTMEALRRLRARGFVTDKESREVGDAYLALRRVEHRIQFATGLQTHALPTDRALLETIARSMGFSGAAELEKDLDKTRKRVAKRFASLLGPARESESARETTDVARLYAALDDHDEAQVRALLPGGLGALASPDLARHVLALARRPDFPLGAVSRDHHPALAAVLLEALAEAADPEQSARLLATFFARIATPSAYVRALAEDPHATRRLCTVLGASAFVGEALVSRPELFDRLVFGRGAPDPESARRAVDEEIAALAPEGASRASLERGPHPAPDVDEFVGALRRAKGRVTMEVGLADLAGELGVREATTTLSALADAIVARALGFAMKERGLDARGLVVVAMGKLGGREIGYGSDLDVFFVYEPAAEDDDEAPARYVRTAQRVIRMLGAPHGDGPGYELDTRLRPSGNQGLLVVSLDAFTRYHAPAHAQDWERQALLKARVCAGDAALGARVMAVAHEAAYERRAPPPERVHHLRMRMEKELAGERRSDDAPPAAGGASSKPAARARYDVKLGRGGLVDVEFAVQWLQMKYGADTRVRTTETAAALDALEACGYVDAALAAPLREGYRTLRRLEQRMRVVHGTSAQLIEEGAPGLAQLARRMGMRDGPRGTASDALLARYRAVTRDVRAAYVQVLGLAPE